ncbi:unannotated protein [freshwater metagenome]|uniref:Unannotated protein n=1 Tax=freshwater metagenome TaxID=449393 RepID=A0A6J6Z2Q0_9ZZZZ
MTNCDRASAIAGTPCLAKSADSTTMTVVIGPTFTVAAIAAPLPIGASTTAVTSPIRAAAVASSAVVLVADSPKKSAKINVRFISTSFLPGK